METGYVIPFVVAANISKGALYHFVALSFVANTIYVWPVFITFITAIPVVLGWFINIQTAKMEPACRAFITAAFNHSIILVCEQVKSSNIHIYIYIIYIHKYIIYLNMSTAGDYICEWIMFCGTGLKIIVSIKLYYIYSMYIFICNNNNNVYLHCTKAVWIYCWIRIWFCWLNDLVQMVGFWFYPTEVNRVHRQILEPLQLGIHIPTRKKCCWKFFTISYICMCCCKQCHIRLCYKL